VIVTVYIDESGTHDSGVTILGGWVGRLGQWATFDPKWKKILRDEQLTYFHSREFRHGKGEFKGWRPERKNAFLDKAKDVSLKHLEFGFVITLPDAAYEQHYVAGHRPKEVQLDSPYGLCFRYLLSIIPGLAKEAFGDRELDVNFILESGHKNAGDAERIFHKCKNTRTNHPEELAIMAMLNTIAFGDKERFPGLQIADVNAYSGFQHEMKPTKLEVIELPAESTMKAAKKKRRTPIFRLELKETVLIGFRKFIQDEIEEKAARRRKVIPASSEEPLS
jgi:Protein of unknown function (DUF3800)